MKKSFPANINGKIFYIDEDAYMLLLDYLSQLRATFQGEEGAEIVNDIESRISEHFDERIKLGANVITINDVNRVIEIMGRPEEISDTPETDAQQKQNEPSRTNDGTPQSERPQPHNTVGPPPPPITKRLYRDVRHKVFGGVIAGLAQYLGWDATIMRILYAILTICTYAWPCIIVYLIAWMVIPVARTPKEILEMQGQPVTLDNIGHTVINNATPPAAPVPGEDPSAFISFINTFFSIAAKFIVGFFAVIFSLTAFTFTAIILASIAGICLLSFAGIPDILEELDFIETNMPIAETWGYICVFFALLIPSLTIVRYCCIPLFKAKSPATVTVITAIIFELLFIIGAFVLLGIAGHSGEYYDYAAWSTTALQYTAAFPLTALLAPSASA